MPDKEKPPEGWGNPAVNETSLPPDPFGPVYVVHVLDIRLLALAGVIGYLIGGIIFGRNHG
jgi:hypothetical protein